MTDRPLFQRPWRSILPAALIAAVALVYFFYLPVSYSFDGTVFSHMLRRALLKHDWLAMAQVHHLLYLPVNYWLVRGLQALCRYRVLEFFHLQLFSLFFGVATLAVIERLLKRQGLSAGPRMAGVALVAFSHAFWRFSVDAEVHIPGLFFIAAGMYLLLGRESGTARLPAAALCFALATGFHLTNGLIVLSVFFILLAERAPRRRFVEFYLSYPAFLGVLYGAFAVAAQRPVLSQLYGVFFSPNPYAGYRISSFHPPSLPVLASSLGSLKEALAAKGGPWSWLLVAAAAMLLVPAWRGRRMAGRSRFLLAMLLWALPFLVFFTFWDSANPEFKLNALLPLLLLAAAGLARLRPFRAGIAGLSLCAGLFLANLHFGIAPQAGIDKNPGYLAALEIRRSTPADALVVITGSPHGFNYGKIYIPYFAGRDVIILDWLLGKGQPLADIRERLQGAGRPIYALEEVVTPGEAMRRMLAFHGVGMDEHGRFLAGFHASPVTRLAIGQMLYSLKVPGPEAGAGH